MPFAGYEDFDDCVSSNADKQNPDAYCATIEQAAKDADAADRASSRRITFQLVPVFADLDGDGIDDETGQPVQPDDSDMPEVESPDDDDMPDMVDEFHTLMIMEGVWTGDGRYIEPAALTWRELPLPLMALDRTTEAHLDAILIGQITRIERNGNELHGYGRFIKSDSEEVTRLQKLVREGDLRGVSADLDAMEYELVSDDEDMMDARIVVTAARIMGVTVVPFPAFQEAFIESTAVLVAALHVEQEASGWVEVFQSFDDLDFSPPEGAREEAARGLAWRDEHGRGGTEVGVARARDISNGRNLSPDTINRMLSYFARHEIDKQGEGWSPDEDGYPSAGRIAWALWGGDPGYAWARGLKRQMDAREERGSVTAAAFPIVPPLVPPAGWFTNPHLDRPTPIHVTDDGRIVGHAAYWQTCHVGYQGRCVEPPKSSKAYANFLVGEIVTDAGERVPVGTITMGTGHAPHNMTAAEAVAHYDHSGFVAADITCGEDQFGIWVSGAVRSDLPGEKIRALMASDLSGDWRTIDGSLELVRLSAVNTPGFHKPRVSIGEDMGLVASLVASFPVPDDARLQRAADRIASTIGRSMEDRRWEIAARIGRTPQARIAELAAKIRRQTF